MILKVFHRFLEMSNERMDLYSTGGELGSPVKKELITNERRA